MKIVFLSVDGYLLKSFRLDYCFVYMQMKLNFAFLFEKTNFIHVKEMKFSSSPLSVYQLITLARATVL